MSKNRPNRAVTDDGLLERSGLVDADIDDKITVKHARSNRQKQSYREKDQQYDPIAQFQINPEDISEYSSFDNLVGVDHIKEKIRNSIILPRIFPEKFNEANEPPKHLMLYGMPGTGKTEIGRAMAKQLDAYFYKINNDILDQIGGGKFQSRKGLQVLFEEAAKKDKPVILFLDEADETVSARGVEGEHGARAETKTELITLLEGIEKGSASNIYFVGATNYPDRIDEAIMARMLAVHVELPDDEAREQLIRNQFSRLPTGKPESDFDYDAIVAETEGFSGRDIRDLIKNAFMERFEHTSDTLNPKILEKEITEDIWSKPVTTDDVLIAQAKQPVNDRPDIRESIEDFEKNR